MVNCCSVVPIWRILRESSLGKESRRVKYLQRWLWLYDREWIILQVEAKSWEQVFVGMCAYSAACPSHSYCGTRPYPSKSIPCFWDFYKEGKKDNILTLLQYVAIVTHRRLHKNLLSFLKFGSYYSKINCPGSRVSMYRIVLTKVPVAVMQLPDEKTNRIVQ